MGLSCSLRCRAKHGFDFYAAGRVSTPPAGPTAGAKERAGTPSPHDLIGGIIPMVSQAAVKGLNRVQVPSYTHQAGSINLVSQWRSPSSNARGGYLP